VAAGVSTEETARGSAPFWSEVNENQYSRELRGQRNVRAVARFDVHNGSAFAPAVDIGAVSPRVICSNSVPL
jgi:hypothetical protein